MSSAAFLEGQLGYDPAASSSSTQSEPASNQANADLRQRLAAEVEEFHRYLAALRLAPEGFALPPLDLDPAVAGSFYDPNSHQIRIRPDLAENPHVVFREYCNYALSLDDPSREFAVATYGLKSALGFYFPCSFTGNQAAFSQFGVNLDDTSPMISRRGSPSPMNQRRAYIWASIFWQARNLLGETIVDHLVVDAWLATVRSAGDAALRLNQSGQAAYRATEKRFVSHLLELLTAEVEPLRVQSFRDILFRRRVLAKSAAAER